MGSGPGSCSQWRSAIAIDLGESANSFSRKSISCVWLGGDFTITVGSLLKHPANTFQKQPVVEQSQFIEAMKTCPHLLDSPDRVMPCFSPTSK